MDPIQFVSTRTVVKQLAEKSIIMTGGARMSRHRRRHEVLVLAYHNIVPTGEPAAGDGSLHLAQRDFAQQLDLLRQTHDVIPLMSLFDSPILGARPRTRPRAVITFDDAYRGAMTAGIAELRRRQMPATMFVTPAYVGGHPFWWDVLTAPDAAALSPELRNTGLTLDAGKDARIVERARNQGMAASSPPANARCANEGELAAALDYPGLTYGSHTWSHPNLARLTPGELAHEMTAPREWLQRYGDRVVPAISYPYGCANTMVWEAAETAGYIAGFMIDGGWVTKPHDTPYRLPRMNVPAGVSADGFALRAAGVIAT
jgi:peptidoglycan/xylan/chitin deacetylase (PgdA/CDA1 family)